MFDLGVDLIWRPHRVRDIEPEKSFVMEAQMPDMVFDETNALPELGSCFLVGFIWPVDIVLECFKLGEVSFILIVLNQVLHDLVEKSERPLSVVKLVWSFIVDRL